MLCKMRAIALLALLVVISPLALGQDTSAPAQGRVRILQTVPLDSKTYMSIISVTDAEGKAVKGISAEQLKVFQNGEPISGFSLSVVSPEDQWVAVVVAIDVSGSMKEGKLEGAKAAALDFAGRVGMRDQLALLAFDRELNWMTEFSTEREDFKKAVENLALRGDTALYDAAMQSMEKCAALEAPRKAIILLTDGKDTASKGTLAECLKKAGDSGIPIFTVGLGNDADAATLQKISEAGKGQYLFAPGPEDLRGIYASIAEQLSAQYVLKHPFTGDPNQSIHELTVEVALAQGAFSDTIEFSSPLDLPSVQQEEQPAAATRSRDVVQVAADVLRRPVTLAFGALGLLTGAVIGLWIGLLLRRRDRGVAAILIVVMLFAFLCGLAGVTVSLLL
jgi:VWFA-related protein